MINLDAADEIRPVGSMLWKPVGGKVFVYLIEDDEVAFAERYTPEQAERLADYIKQVATRARNGENVPLTADEIERLDYEEGEPSGQGNFIFNPFDEE